MRLGVARWLRGAGCAVAALVALVAVAVVALVAVALVALVALWLPDAHDHEHASASPGQSSQLRQRKVPCSSSRLKLLSFLWQRAEEYALCRCEEYRGNCNVLASSRHVPHEHLQHKRFVLSVLPPSAPIQSPTSTCSTNTLCSQCSRAMLP